MLSARQWRDSAPKPQTPNPKPQTPNPKPLSSKKKTQNKMIATDFTREYLICKECRPYMQAVVEDMTAFVGNEISRLHDQQLLKLKKSLIQSRKNEIKLQYTVITDFIKKITSDLERNEFEFVKSYIGDFMITISANEYTSMHNKSGTHFCSFYLNFPKIYMIIT